MTESQIVIIITVSCIVIYGLPLVYCILKSISEESKDAELQIQKRKYEIGNRPPQYVPEQIISPADEARTRSYQVIKEEIEKRALLGMSFLIVYDMPWWLECTLKRDGFNIQYEEDVYDPDPHGDSEDSQLEVSNQRYVISW
jgi:hypothetical protein